MKGLHFPRAAVLLLYAAIIFITVYTVHVFGADLGKLSFAAVMDHKSVMVLTMVLAFSNYLLRAARWRFYLARLGYAVPFGRSMLIYLAGFAFTLSPGKVGEMARASYYQKLGVPVSACAATFLVERSLDVFILAILACLAFGAASDYSTLSFALLALFVCVLAVVALAPWARWSVKLEENAQNSAWRRLVAGGARTFAEARALLTPWCLVVGITLGGIGWTIEGTGLFAVSSMSPTQLDVALAIGIYSAAIVVGAASFLPGGLGTAEAVMIALLVKHGFSASDALLVTITCRLLTLWFAVLIGWIAVLILRRSAPAKVSAT